MADRTRLGPPWQEALRLNPGYSLEHRREILPYQDPATFEQVVAGLRKAGIAVRSRRQEVARDPSDC